MTPRREFHEGWKVVLACVFGIACGTATLPIYTIGALVVPLTGDTGWSRSAVQGSTLVTFSLGALMAPLVGTVLDRVGVRWVAVIGLMGVSLGFAIAAGATSLPFFYLGYGVMAVVGAGSSPVTWTRAIAGAFERHRGLALGFALSGTGIAAILGPQYATYFANTYGWRPAMLGLALLPILVIPLSLAFLPRKLISTSVAVPAGDKSQTSATGLSLAEAIRSYRFWVLIVSVAALYLGIVGIISNMIPALIDRGIAPQAAAGALGIFGTSIIVGRLVVGFLVDRFWAPLVAALALTPGAVSCFIFSFSTEYAALLSAAAIAGMAAGAELDVLAFLTARYFGLRSFGRIYGLLYAVVSLAAGLGPMAFAYLYEVTGDYRASFQAAAVLFIVGGPILLTLGRYPKFNNSMPDTAGGQRISPAASG